MSANVRPAGPSTYSITSSSTSTSTSSSSTNSGESGAISPSSSRSSSSLASDSSGAVTPTAAKSYVASSLSYSEMASSSSTPTRDSTLKNMLGQSSSLMMAMLQRGDEALPGLQSQVAQGSQQSSGKSGDKKDKTKQPKWLNTTFGTFILGDLIGRGAQSKVYRAMSTTGAFVAVKKINTVGVDNTILDAVQREVDILKMVEHPNVIKVIGLHKTPKSLCLILEYAENGSLDRLLKEFSALPEPLVLAFAKQILSALVCLHSKHIIHRDIKAGNCLVSKDGSIKLADFGISTVMQNDNKNFSLVGSPFWMAPEVIQNNGHDALSDIWSLGITIYELITGNPPFYEGSGFNAMFRITQCEIPVPTNCSPELQDFLKLCLQKDPKDRPCATKLASHPWITGSALNSVPSPQQDEMCRAEEEKKEQERQSQIQEQQRQEQRRQELQSQSLEQSAEAQESPQSMYDSLRSAGVPRVENILATLLDPNVSLKKAQAQVIHNMNAAERRQRNLSMPPDCLQLDVRGVETYAPAQGSQLPSGPPDEPPPAIQRSPISPSTPPNSPSKFPNSQLSPTSRSIISPHTRHLSHTPPQVPALKLNLLNLPATPMPSAPQPTDQPHVQLRFSPRAQPPHLHPLSPLQQRTSSTNLLANIPEVTSSPRHRNLSFAVPSPRSTPSPPQTRQPYIPQLQPYIPQLPSTNVPFSPRQANPAAAHLPIYVNPSITPSAVAASIFHTPASSSPLVTNVLRAPTPETNTPRRRHVSMAVTPTTPTVPVEAIRAPLSSRPPPENQQGDEEPGHHHHKHEHHSKPGHHTPETPRSSSKSKHARKRSSTCEVPPLSARQPGMALPLSARQPTANRTPPLAIESHETISETSDPLQDPEPIMEKATRVPADASAVVEHMSESQLAQQLNKMREYLVDVGRERAPSYPSIQIKPHLVLSLEPAMVKSVPCSRIWSLMLVKGVVWVGGSEGTVLLWEAETFNQFSVVQLHDTRVYCMLLVGDSVYVSSEEGYIFVVNAQSLAFHKVRVHDKAHPIIKCMHPVTSSPTGANTGDLAGLGAGGVDPHVWSFGCGADGTQIAILYKSKVHGQSTFRVHGQFTIPHQANSVCVLDNTVWMGCYGNLVYIPNATNFNSTGSGVVEIKTSDLHMKEITLPRRRKVGSIIAVGVHILAACGNTIFICQKEGIINQIQQESEIERLCLFQNLILSSHFNGNIVCYDPICNYRQVRVLRFPDKPLGSSACIAMNSTSSSTATGTPAEPQPDKKHSTEASATGVGSTVSGDSDNEMESASASATHESNTAARDSTPVDPNFGCGKRLATVLGPVTYSSWFGECGVKSLLPVVLEDSASFWAGNTSNLLCVWRPSLPPSLVTGNASGIPTNPTLRALTSTATNPLLFANPLNPLSVPAPPVFPISSTGFSTNPQTPRAMSSSVPEHPQPCTPRPTSASASPVPNIKHNNLLLSPLKDNPKILTTTTTTSTTTTITSTTTVTAPGNTSNLVPPLKSPRHMKSPTPLDTSPKPETNNTDAGSPKPSSRHHHHKHRHHNRGTTNHSTSPSPTPNDSPSTSPPPPQHQSDSNNNSTGTTPTSPPQMTVSTQVPVTPRGGRR
ncbi:STE/STE11/CDC15 protein kinase [Pelomyxa schiedti]|nr:STE/STE11/CDC15 protein kinase [Pelomyxa schiedti]